MTLGGDMVCDSGVDAAVRVVCRNLSSHARIDVISFPSMLIALSGALLPSAVP